MRRHVRIKMLQPKGALFTEYIQGDCLSNCFFFSEIKALMNGNHYQKQLVDFWFGRELCDSMEDVLDDLHIVGWHVKDGRFVKK